MKLLRQENGQAMVELAFAVTVMVILLSGIVEFGRIFSTYFIMNHAAREGVRVAVVTGNNTMVESKIKEIMASIARDPANYTIDITTSNSPTGVLVWTVNITYDLPLIMPFFTPLLGNPYRLNASCSMDQ